MALHNHATWNCLVGAYVEMRRKGEVVRAGTVEDVMHDSSALWLAAEGAHSRAIFEAADGFEVWIDSRQLAHRGCGEFNPILLYPMP